MDVLCLSDIHGNLPNNLPKADLLLIAGDICPTFDHSIDFQKSWLSTNFYEWCKETLKNITDIVYIAGNHDFFFQKNYISSSFTKWQTPVSRMGIDPHIFYLQDEGINLNGLKIWGTPWQRRFYDWAFNLDEPELAKKWDLIPNDTDIIVCHGPAHGYGDTVTSRSWKDEEKWPEPEHVGSPSMLAKIDEIKPKLYVCGHIHSGYGIKMRGNTHMVNASYVNERYVPSNQPILITL